MAKYYDKKLYYKHYYHNRLVKMDSTGRIIKEDDKYVEEHVPRTFNNFGAISRNKLHYWHRKRKSKYAVIYDEFAYVLYLNKRSATLNGINFSKSQLYFIGVINGISYFESKFSTKYEDDSGENRYLAKSKDGLLIETFIPIITDSNNHFKVCNAYKKLILIDETYTTENNLITASDVKYLKFNPENDSISSINLSSKAPEGSVVTGVAFPFVTIAPLNSIKYKRDDTIYNKNVNKRKIGELYYITEDDQLIKISDSLRLTDYTYFKLVREKPGSPAHYKHYYHTTDLVDKCRSAVFIFFSKCFFDLNENAAIASCSCSLYNGDFFLLSFRYYFITNTLTNLSVYDETTETYIDVYKPFTESYPDGYIYIYFRDDPRHKYSISKNGLTTNQIRFFETNDEIVGRDVCYFECVAWDCNYFYFHGGDAGKYAFLKTSDLSTFDISTTQGSGYDTTYFDLYDFIDSQEKISWQGDMSQKRLGVNLYLIPVYENGVFSDFVFGRYERVNNYTWYLFKSLSYINGRVELYFHLTKLLYTICPIGQTRDPCFSTDTSNVSEQTPVNLDTFYQNIE